MFYISRQMSVQVSNYARTRKLSAHAWTAVISNRPYKS